MTAADLDYYIRRGRQLRAEAMASFVRRLGTALARALHRLLPAAGSRPARGDDPLSVIASQLRTPLTSIRASAEILRDYPEIDPLDRSRFLSIVLNEQARLDALVSTILEASSVEQRRRIWRVRLEQVRAKDSSPALHAC